MKGDVKEMTYECGKYQACLWMVGRCWFRVEKWRLVSSLHWGPTGWFQVWKALFEDMSMQIYIFFIYIGYGRHPSSNCDHQNSSILSMGSLQILTCHCYWEGATPSIYIHIHIHQKASMSQVELQCFEPEDSSLIHGATSGFVKWYISVGMKFYFMIFQLMVNRNLQWICNRQIMTDFLKDDSNRSSFAI